MKWTCTHARRSQRPTAQVSELHLTTHFYASPVVGVVREIADRPDLSMNRLKFGALCALRVC